MLPRAYESVRGSKLQKVIDMIDNTHNVESPENKFARLCKAVEDLQEELEKIYDGNETPILEITPGGCNFVIGDDIIFDSQSADEVLKGIIDRNWEE